MSSKLKNVTVVAIFLLKQVVIIVHGIDQLSLCKICHWHCLCM